MSEASHPHWDILLLRSFLSTSVTSVRGMVEFSLKPSDSASSTEDMLVSYGRSSVYNFFLFTTTPVRVGNSPAERSLVQAHCEVLCSLLPQLVFCFNNWSCLTQYLPAAKYSSLTILKYIADSKADRNTGVIQVLQSEGATS